MRNAWTMRTVIGVVVFCVACSTAWSEEGKANEDPQAKLNELRQAMSEIQQELRPAMREALKADEALGDLRKELGEVQTKLWQQDRELQMKGLKLLAQKQPDLAESIKLIQELEQKSRELMQQMRKGGEGANDAREELQEVRKDSRELWNSVNRPLRQIMNEDEEIRAARQKLDDERKVVTEQTRDFNEKLDAKMIEISPEAKELLDERKALQEQQQALYAQQQARRQRMIQEQREKFAELNKQVRELQQKLYPVRNRLMAQDAEVKELAAKLEQVLEAKMVKAAPELAEVIKQRNELQEQMRQLMRPRPAE